MARVGKHTSALKRQALTAVVVVALIGAAVAVLWHLNNREPSLYLLIGMVGGLIFLAILLSNFSLIYIRGYLGERIVYGRLRRLPDDYWVFNDVTVAAGDKSAQIDHVLVSPAGVWCVETKSHLGMVLGKERERNWTQVKHSESGRRYKKKLYNPIRQNATHCKVLGQYLDEQLGLRPPVKSVVVFTSAKLKLEVTTPVVKPNALVETVLAGDEGQAAAPEDKVAAIVAALGGPAIEPMSDEVVSDAREIRSDAVDGGADDAPGSDDDGIRGSG